MDEQLLNVLKSNRIFSSLDEVSSKRLLSKFSQVEIQKDQVLFYQGDPSDSIYLVISGKLGAELTSAAGDTRIIGHIDQTETVGESGALTNEPRTLTVKALKDTKLLKLSARDFIEICHQYPAVMFATVHPIISRSKSIIQMLSAEKTSKHIVIVAAYHQVSLEDFLAKLQEVADKLPSVLLVSDYFKEFHDKNADSATVKEKIHKFSQNKKSSHKIVYVLGWHDSPLAKVAFKKASMVYIAGHSQVTPKIDSHVLAKLQSRHSHFNSDPELIIIHPEGTTAPHNTDAWLAQTDFRLHHHVRLDNSRDIHRLLRFVRGRANGLVLSGGGTRGWAHLGAIKAIRESKVPIDMIGGVSVGAIVGACYALHESYEEAYERFYDVVVGSSHSVSFRSLTWPSISIFSAKYFTQALVDAFGTMQIEDLWLPYFCVSSNLATGSETVHTQGSLWEINRASSSLPGLIPPMLINGEMHLDGGLLNNLPVDIMRGYLGSKARIIAVELNSFAPDKHRYDFPPVMTFIDTLKNKLGLTPHKYKLPKFVDSFMRGLFVGSMLKSRQNSLAANIYVSLDLRKFSLLRSNPQQADKLIEIGYQEANKQILLSKSKEQTVPFETQPKE